jgi:hypothetical protein
MMNKFEKKSYEMELLGKMYATLTYEEKWNMNHDLDTDTYHEPTNEYNLDRLEVIRELMAKVEKMI